VASRHYAFSPLMGKHYDPLVVANEELCLDTIWYI
jgi:hypothetical protein